MLHIARLIKRRYPERASAVIRLLLIASAIGVAAGFATLLLR
jgi:H+/Cl- antiporter ClcA